MINLVIKTGIITLNELCDNFSQISINLQVEKRKQGIRSCSLNLVKLVPYSLLGQINQGNILISLLLAPLAWLGVKLGLSIQDKISDRLFKRIILILMVLVGIRLLWTAL